MDTMSAMTGLRTFTMFLLSSVLAQWIALSSARADTLTDVVASFYPQALVSAAPASQFQNFSCFVQLDADTIIASYSNGVLGDVLVLKIGQNGQYIDAFDTGLLSKAPGRCSTKLVNLSQEATASILVSFFDMRGNSADFVFDWNGSALKSIGPMAQSFVGRYYSLLTNTFGVDVYHDGTLELLSQGYYPPASDPASAVPDTLYKLRNGELERVADPLLFEGMISQKTASQQTYNYQFFSSSVVPGPFILRVVNGTADAQQSITSGTITLNGQVVFAPSQFNATAEFLTATVAPEGSNLIQIDTNGPPGSQAIVTIEGQPSGDLNLDGVVDCADIAIVKAAFGKKTGQSGFDPRADVNVDGVVDVRDLAIVSKQLPAGTTCP